MSPVSATEAIRRVAALWGPARKPAVAVDPDALPSLLRLDPSTGDEAKQRLQGLLSEVDVRWEGPVEGRAQMRWPSEARCQRSPPLLVITARDVVVFENQRPDEAHAALHGLARARELRPRAIWIGPAPVPDGWTPLSPERLVERA
jgi:hypothetical protein